ncbi:MAG TPA: hypothetical protein VKE69_11575, partial [Planctomycetota bacterium]|nr:hypothetical protein [Planctomycetota bacterium]
GNAAFRLICTNAPRRALGLGLVASAPDVAGTNFLALGMTLHVDPFASAVFLGLDFFSDPVGVGAAALPIPNLPSLAGATLYGQSIWIEDAPNGQLTSGAFVGLVSSVGLSFTIQP